MKQVELRTLRRGDWFKRKPEASQHYIREHYNRKDQFGPAGYWCSKEFAHDQGMQLKPGTLVWVDEY